MKIAEQGSDEYVPYTVTINTKEKATENIDSVSYERFMDGMTDYLLSPDFGNDVRRTRRSRMAQRVSPTEAQVLPETLPEGMADGAYKFVTEDGQVLGIIKEGKNYYIYDYASNNISFAQSKADINKLLSDIQAQRGTGDIAAAVPMDEPSNAEVQNSSDVVLKKSADSGTINYNYNKTEEGNHYERQTGENRLLRGDTVRTSRGSAKISSEGSRTPRNSNTSRIYGESGKTRILSEDTEGRIINNNIRKQLEGTAIKDKDGRPVSLYHSTDKVFDKFAIGDIGFHFGSKHQADTRARAKKFDNPRYVNAYLNIKNPLRIDSDYMNWHANSVALHMWNAGLISDAEKNAVVSLWSKGKNYDSPASNKLREILEGKGYDGIAYSNGFEGEGTSYIVFYDEQIIRVEDSSAKDSNSKVSNDATSTLSNDNPSRIDAINPKKIHEYLRENVKGYKALSEPNQAMVRAIIRQGRTLGIPEADLLLYAKVATRSGVNIVFDKEATYLGKDSKTGKDVYADGFYQRSQNRIVVNPEGTRSAERLLIHELTHAIFKTPSGTIILMNGVKNLSQDEKDRITKNYSKLHKNSSGGEISLKIMDEQNAAYAEGVLSDRAILEKLVSDKPKLKDMILDFFTKAKSDYAGEDKLDAAAKKLYRQYKKLFDEFSARNADTNAVERTVRGKSDEREYALRVKHTNGTETIVNPYEITKEQTLEFVRRARNGELKENTYFPVRESTQSSLIAVLKHNGIKIDDRPIAMQAKKARRSQIEGKSARVNGKIIRYHALSASEIVEAIDNMGAPDEIIHQTNRSRTIRNADGTEEKIPAPDNFAVFVRLKNGKQCVVVIEFDSYITEEYILRDSKSDNYHTTVTVFEPDVVRDGLPFDYVEYLLENDSNFELNLNVDIKENSNSKAATSETLTTASKKEFSNNSIPQNQQKSTQNSKKFDEEDYALPQDFDWDSLEEIFAEADDTSSEMFDADAVIVKGPPTENLSAPKGIKQVVANFSNERVYGKGVMMFFIF